MTAVVAAESNRLLEASLGRTAFVAPTTPMQVALCTAVGTNTAAGTEVTNSGGSTYARQSVTTWNAASSGAITNSTALSFTNMPAATVTSLDIFDSNGTPRRAWYGSLTASKTLNLGDTLSMATGAISISIG